MGPIERFTRDDVSKYIWASLLLAAIAGLIFTFTSGNDAVEDARLASERRAVAAVEEVLAPRLDASDLQAPFTSSEATSLRATLARSILADPRIARVRIWAGDGDLLFSTDREEDVGSNAALNDDVLDRAASGPTITRWNLSDTGGVDEAGRSLVRTYIRFGFDSVVEVDQTAEGTITPVRELWRGYQIVGAVLVTLFLLLTVLSLRDPIERINTGVRFAPSSIPAGYSLIDDERLHSVEEVYRLAHDRVARLEEKLAESETMRRRLEGDIQRALTSAATAPRSTSRAPAAEPPATAATANAPQVAPAPEVTKPAAPARPAAAAVPAAAEPSTTNGPAPGTKRRERPPAVAPSPATPRVVQLPDSEVVADARAAAHGGPLARAVREDPSAPQIRPTRGPERPKRAPRRKRKPDATAVPSSLPPPAAEPEKPKRDLLKRKPEPVAAVVPPASAPRGIDDAKAHEAALETFIRLTESNRQHAESDQVDQGAVRAALARTAARKKPGGHKLKSHEGPPEETPGGPPRGSE